MGLYGNEALNKFSILNEEVIYKNQNMSIRVDNSNTNRGFLKNPYFKVYNSDDYTKYTKLTRISMTKPEYIIHNNEIWNLNSKEKKLLIDILNSTTKKGISVWESLKNIIKTYPFITKEDKEFINSLSIPNYLNL